MNGKRRRRRERGRGIGRGRGGRKGWWAGGLKRGRKMDIS
tara:strand:- start:912 stop:1031 length:120 start_codon:yes stop_codon:yes gene_type:complete